MRIFLLLVVLGGLTILLGQNWSPVLPLVFLGVQTQALPLAVWILLSIAAGALTSLFIAGLFKLANYLAPPSKRRKVQPPPRSSDQRSERYTAASRPSSPPDPDSTPRNAADDWGSDPTTNDDDWDFEEGTNKTPSHPPDEPRSKTYEVSSKPKSGYQTESYSYYQEPSNSSVGKPESVYDADYRVIAPPYRQPDIAEAQEFHAAPNAVPNTATSPSQPPDSTPSNASDDWNSDSSDDDWDFDEDTEETPSGSDPVKKSTTYEVSNAPKSGHRSGSIYSYSYREAKNLDGGTNSVSDANSRVTPPQRELDTSQDDDWGFEDDDDFDGGHADIKQR